MINPLSSLLRQLKRSKGIVAINTVGLTLGLVSVIFIALWVNHSLSYDRWHDKADRIFRVESLLDFGDEPFVWNVAPAPAAKAMKEDFPEVESSVNLYSAYRASMRIGEEIFIAENAYYTTNSIFNVFSFDLILGNKENCLTDPESIVISESAAKKYFGDENPLGKTIVFQNKDLLKVTGVLKDLPTNSHLQINYLMSWNLLVQQGKKLDSWGQFDYYTYVLLGENIEADTFNRKLSGYLKSKTEDSGAVLFLNPLTRVFLYRDPGLDSIVYPQKGKEPVSTVILLAVIGIVILVIAVINFINLSTAAAAQRSAEIGIRKVNGASRRGLLIHLFSESLLQTVFSVIVALGIVVLLRPAFSKLTGTNLDLQFLFSLKSIGIYLLLTIITATVSGFYPAVILSSFKPVSVLKNDPSSFFQGSTLRKILVVVQFTLAAVFIFSILVMSGQIRFMQSQDQGFNSENLMVVYPRTDIDKAKVIKERIKALPGVADVAIGGNVPVNMGNWSTFSNWDGNTSGKALKFHMMQMDDSYFDLLGFELTEGRKLREGESRNEVIINEAAVRLMGITDPLGKFIRKNYNNQEFEIVGIVKDFHFKKLSEEIKPVMMFKRKDWYSPRLFIKLHPVGISNAIDNISTIVSEEIPGFPVRHIFLDEEIARYYDEDRRLSSLINIATLLSIIISAIGLFSLTAYATGRRHKEIGIRKAHGASASGLLLLLNKEYFYLILPSIIVGFPLGYIVMKQWLAGYAFHINISTVYYILAFIIILIISTVTTSFHTLKAANLNPADTLRDE